MKISDRLSKLQAKWEDLVPQNEEIGALLQELSRDIKEQERQLNTLSVAGAELSKLQKQSTALELILDTARNLTNADAGTVYILVEEYDDNPFSPGVVKSQRLSFEVVQNETMNVYLRRAESEKDILPPVPLKIDDCPNHQNVCAYCANTGQIVNIQDAYHAQGFDFSGMKKYDETTGYHSQSMLVLPLRDHESELIGVLQLINRKTTDGTIISFSEHDQTIVHAMAYQAAISLTTQKLLKEQVELFNSFVHVLAEGLGEKSPHTFAHITRVANLTVELAEAIGKNTDGMYKDIRFNKTQMEELRLSGWMHDIGKLTAPEHIVSKSIKLEVLLDRIELILERYNSKIKDIEIEALEERIGGLEANQSPGFFKEIGIRKMQRIHKLINDLQTLIKTNLGRESIEKKEIELIHRNAQFTTARYIIPNYHNINGTERITSVSLADNIHRIPLLSEEEKEYLLITRGTLSKSERKIICDHADRSWRWLVQLPFPKNMIHLPLFAGAHHETLNGNGYPNHLTAEQLPIQSRIIAIADVFEALTAHDRPYKPPMPLSRAINILGEMVKNSSLDAEIVRIFLESGLYIQYAKKFLDKDQIDTIDIKTWVERYYPKNFAHTLPEHTIS